MLVLHKTTADIGRVCLRSMNLTGVFLLWKIFLEDRLKRSFDSVDRAGSCGEGVRLSELVKEDSSLGASSPNIFIHPRQCLVVVRHPDWSEESAAGTVPGPAAGPRPTRRGTVGGEVSVDLHVWQPGPQLPDAAPGDSLAVVTKQDDHVPVRLRDLLTVRSC